MWTKRGQGLLAKGLCWFIYLDPIEHDSYSPQSNLDHELMKPDPSEELDLVALMLMHKHRRVFGLATFPALQTLTEVWIKLAATLSFFFFKFSWYLHSNLALTTSSYF